MKTHSVLGTNKFTLKLDNRRRLHVPTVLLQQNDLPGPLDRRLCEPKNRSGRFGVDVIPLRNPEFEPAFLSFPACCLVIFTIT